MSGVVLRATRSPDEGLPRLASALVMLLGLSALLDAVYGVLAAQYVGLAGEFSGGSVSVAGELAGTASTIDLLRTVRGVTLLFAFGCWLVWQHRVASEGRVDRAIARRTPGWQVASWLIPGVNLTAPLRDLCDLGRALPRPGDAGTHQAEPPVRERAGRAPSDRTPPAVGPRALRAGWCCLLVAVALELLGEWAVARANGTAVGADPDAVLTPLRHGVALVAAAQVPAVAALVVGVLVVNDLTARATAVSAPVRRAVASRV